MDHTHVLVTGRDIKNKRLHRVDADCPVINAIDSNRLVSVNREDHPNNRECRFCDGSATPGMHTGRTLASKLLHMDPDEL